MSEEQAAPEPQPGPLPPNRPFGMIALIVIVIVGVAAILWGRFVINPQPEVFLFDAGPAEQFQVGEPVWFPDVRIFVIAVDDDGERRMIRALDAIARGTGCTIELRPDDPRGAARNPLGRNGVYTDPCSAGVWALGGEAIDGTTSPLRTFRITRPQPVDARDRPLIEVEVIGRPEPTATGTAP